MKVWIVEAFLLFLDTQQRLDLWPRLQLKWFQMLAPRRRPPRLLLRRRSLARNGVRNDAWGVQNGVRNDARGAQNAVRPVARGAQSDGKSGATVPPKRKSSMKPSRLTV